MVPDLKRKQSIEPLKCPTGVLNNEVRATNTAFYPPGGFSSIHRLLLCVGVPELGFDNHPVWASFVSEVESAFDNEVSRLRAGHGSTWDAATVMMEAKKVAVKREETTERRWAVFRRKLRRRCMGLIGKSPIQVHTDTNRAHMDELSSACRRYAKLQAGL